MKVLVVGGTGFIGKPLVRALVVHGHEVIVFGREDDIDRPDSVKMVTGNVLDKNALRKAFSKIDIVFHLAACSDEMDSRLWGTNVTGTENVAQLCSEKKVKQIVFMSSAGVVGDSRVPAKENSHYNPSTLFDKSKAAAEHIVKDSGINYTIIRAPPVLGPNVMWSKVFDAVKNGHPVTGTGNNKFHLIHVEDVVSLLVLVMNNEKAANHVFNAGTKDLMTYLEFHDTVRKELRSKKSLTYRSPNFAHLLSHAHRIKKAVEIKPVHVHMSKQYLDMTTRNCALSIRKAKDVLGFEPTYTTPEAIHMTAKDLY